MGHMGVPAAWAILAWLVALVMLGRALLSPLPRGDARTRGGRVVWSITKLLRSQRILLAIKWMMVVLFVAVIASGLYGTPVPRNNIATQWTWNIWWAGLIVAVFFVGSGWCSVCPWESIASWLTRLNIWGHPNQAASLGLPVPRWLRGVWPALLLLLLLTWLELGYGVTADPYATALLALVMVVATTVSHALFERKAFCRHFCPVGRTIGFYAQLAPVALRQIDPAVCAACRSLDCYHGNAQVEPCPTGLVIKNLQENTYCTSCGNCLRSCPQQNVGWQLRSVSSEACQEARPRNDEAWFVLVLLALAALHGLTMMPFWQPQMVRLDGWLGGRIGAVSLFAIALVGTVLAVTSLYAAAVALTRWSFAGSIRFTRLFIGMAFMLLPLAFSYHIAHNLNHLVHENHWLSWDGGMVLPLLQVGLVVGGCWLSLLIMRHRGSRLGCGDGWRLMPLALLALLITGLHLWLLAQPMMMRF